MSTENRAVLDGRRDASDALADRWQARARASCYAPQWCPTCRQAFADYVEAIKLADAAHEAAEAARKRLRGGEAVHGQHPQEAPKVVTGPMPWAYGERCPRTRDWIG